MKTSIIRKLGYLIALVVLDSLFFGFTNPTRSYSLVVIGGILLLAANIYALMWLVLRVLSIYVPIAKHGIKRLAGVCSLIVTLLVAMQSIGQLTPKDVFALVPLLLVLAFYVYYSKRQTR